MLHHACTLGHQHHASFSPSSFLRRQVSRISLPISPASSNTPTAIVTETAIVDEMIAIVSLSRSILFHLDGRV